MKLKTFKSILPILGGAIFCIALASCKGFFSDNDLAQKIQDAISYANAASWEIRVECDPEEGTFITPAILSKKVTDEFTIEFRLAEGYSLKGWQAWSKASDGTLNKLSSEYIKFLSYDTQSSDGIYKASVKFLKSAQNIVIKPLCVPFPFVQYRAPESGKNCYANTPIVLTFNIPMDSTESAAQLFNWNNISLTYLGQPLNDYFEPPVYDSNTNTLTLMPVCEDIAGDESTDTPAKVSLATYIDQTLRLSYIDLQVSLQNITVGDLPLIQDSNTVFTVRYLKAKETTKPECAQFFVTREQISLDSHDHINEFTDKALADFDDENVHQNATVGIIYIYGVYKDTDSGVKTVTVTEKHTNDTTGAALTENARTPVSYTAQNSPAAFTTNSSGFTTFCFPYTIQSGDGAVLITVDVMDACQNHTEQPQSFTVIKKSSISIDDVLLTNLRGDAKTIVKDAGTSDAVKALVRNIKVERKINADSDNNNFCQKLYGTTCYFANDYTITCEYEGVPGEFTLVDGDDIKDQYWHYTIQEDGSLENKTVTVFVRDFLGNTAQNTYSFPSDLYLVHVYQDNTVYYSYYQGETLGNHNSLCVNINISDNNIGQVYYLQSNSTDDFAGHGTYHYDYGLSWAMYKSYTMTKSSSGLWGELSKTDFNSQITVEYLSDEVELSAAPQVSRSDVPDVVDITLTVEPGVWNTFDRIYACLQSQVPHDPGYWVANQYYLKEPWAFVEFAYGETSAVARMKKEHMLKYATEVWMFGEKNKKRTELGHRYLITKIDGAVCDSTKPALTIPLLSYEHDCFRGWVSDTESKLNEAKLIINGVETPITKDDDAESTDETWYFNIPIVDVLTNGSLGITVQVSDKAGNSAEYSETLIVKTAGADWESVDQSSSPWTLITDAMTERYYPFNVHFPEDGGPSYDVNTKLPWLGIYKFDSGSNTWGDYTYQQVSARAWNEGHENTNPSYTFTYTYTPDSQNPTFVRIARFDTFIGYEDSFNRKPDSGIPCSSVPRYYYTGAINSGNFDLLFPNGTSTTSVAIESDAPVFVQTLVTNISYSECKDWTTAQWDFYQQALNEKILEFSATDHSPKRYTIPVGEINAGQSYCVIAHFADGTTAQSQVWQK